MVVEIDDKIYKNLGVKTFEERDNKDDSLHSDS